MSNTPLSLSSCSIASSPDDEIDVDTGALRPFNFEPNITDKGSVSSSSNSGSSEQDEGNNLRIGNNIWCSCGHCKPTQISAESLCCRDTSEVPDEKFDGRILYYFISLPSIPIKLCKTNISLASATS